MPQELVRRGGGGVNINISVVDHSHPTISRPGYLTRACLPPNMATMEVELYVYDLTHGMARQMSRQFLGIQIDAVYHTSLVFGGIEYFFGAGVQTCYAGQTHHGHPMEKILLGSTNLPLETILEYLESLKQIYTPESYDLFAHNCNNFSNDFAMFLVGRGIPDHITSLPARVLETPFGQMLKPQIDASMRQVTQAPVPAQNVPTQPTTNGTTAHKTESTVDTSSPTHGSVVNVTDLPSLERHLKGAQATVSTVFFTSSTCAPCRLAYPTYDSLAEQYPQALFVKADINYAQDVASRYQIRATPTFMTFVKGTKTDEWSGADPSLLKSNVERAIQQAFPPHPHTLMSVPTLQFGSMKPVVYAKVPPLDKLIAKLGSSGQQQEFAALKQFVEKRTQDPREATLPALAQLSFADKILTLPLDVRFAAVDLLRCAMVDPRVSGFYAEQLGHATVATIIRSVNENHATPHNLRLVTLHLACNLFTSPLFVAEILKSGNDLITLIVQLITTSLLDATHPTTRVAAASLAFNIATANYRIRREEGEEALADGEQVELAASLLETLGEENNPDASKALLLALGYLVYCAPRDGELMDLCKALDAKATVGAVKGQETLAKEIEGLF
ncbi:Desumoylating isopeptidase 1 [Teratosphaeria destructans]|uniref:Desumoylating isopeptidase 1 n=1 Tax=Teratosphaeria destructans TaxID=418781 RepID=A0A9W7SVY0_9PEZI|nr:Desumoylating isopeptidase 1 [Teratosphaeria destructans]